MSLAPLGCHWLSQPACCASTREIANGSCGGCVDFALVVAAVSAYAAAGAVMLTPTAATAASAVTTGSLIVPPEVLGEPVKEDCRPGRSGGDGRRVRNVLDRSRNRRHVGETRW